MTSTFNTAFLLMLVGMLTVFAMLVIVYWVGNIIISITNSMYKEPPVPKVSEIKMVDVESQKIAVIVSTVNRVTSGKGKVISIQKIK